MCSFIDDHVERVINSQSIGRFHIECIVHFLRHYRLSSLLVSLKSLSTDGDRVSEVEIADNSMTQKRFEDDTRMYS